MKKALSVTDICKKSYKLLPFEGEWKAAFAEPERVGTWIIWGNSGSGKSTFAMQLCKELSRYGKVIYDSLEEGTSLTFRNKIAQLGELERGKFQVVSESMAELSSRLEKRRSADFVVIDSFQYTEFDYRSYLEFKKKHANKLLVFVSHAEGRNPAGRSAKSVMYDATLKIWVEGYKAYSKGRFIGDNGGVYTIWEAGAQIIGIDNNTNNNQ